MCCLFMCINILYLESEIVQDKVRAKPLPRTCNFIKNEGNVESDEVCPKPLKIIGTSPKGT